MTNRNTANHAALPPPHRVVDTQSCILLGAFLLTGVVLGCYTKGYVLPDLYDRVSGIVLAAMSGAGPKNSLIHTAVFFLAPSVLCTVCAYTTFGVVLIPPALTLVGYAVGCTLTFAIEIFGVFAIAVLLVLYGILFFVQLSCLLLIASQSMEASVSILKLASGKFPQRLPVFSRLFYRRFIAGCFILFLILVLWVYLTPIIISTLF